MSDLLSPRIGKTGHMVVMPSSLEEPRRPRGLFWVFLLCFFGYLLTTFAALIVAFLWRAQNQAFWQPVTLPSLMLWSSAVIVLSSATMETAHQLYRKGRHLMFQRWMVFTAMLGVGFLVLQTLAWRQLFAQGAFMDSNPHASFYYVFTGGHGVHLIGGLGALAWVLYRTRNPLSPRRRETLAVVSWYWHVMGILWLILFFVLSVYSS